MNEERLERALKNLPRVKPANDLSARIIAQLPAVNAARQRRLVPVTLGAALLGIAFAFQSAMDMYNNGALELLSYYAAQPAIVTTYPHEAFVVIACAMPWLSIFASACVLGLALALVRRVTGNARGIILRG